MLLPNRPQSIAPQDSSNPRRLNLPAQYENDQQSTGRGILGRRSQRENEAYFQPKVEAAGKVLGSLGAPQRKMMQGLTGTEQTPGEYLVKKGYLRPDAGGVKGLLGSFGKVAADVVADPMNLVGAGIAGKMAGAGKLARASEKFPLLVHAESERLGLEAMAEHLKKRAATPYREKYFPSDGAGANVPAGAATSGASAETRPAGPATRAGAQVPAGPNTPARVPSGSGPQSLREPSPGSAKPSLRDVYDIHLEEGAGRPLYKEGDEMKRWDADQRGAHYDDARYNQANIARNYVAAREARMQQPGGSMPAPATMQASAQYTREANKLTPSSLRTVRSRAEDAKATHWASNPATERQFTAAAEADGQGNVAERLARFRQNVQYPLFEAPLAGNLNGLQFTKARRIFMDTALPDAQYARTAEHEVGHLSQLIGKTRDASLLPDEFDRLAKARLDTPRANAADQPTKDYPTGYHREPEEIASRLREVRGALQKEHGQPVPLREYLQEMRNSHPETHRSVKPHAAWQALNRLPLGILLPAAGGAAALGAQRKAKGGLLPAKLTMLGPDGKAQMELGGGNRIFSRANTAELVSRSQRAKTPAELKELGGRIKAMLDQQDRNKPEYVHD